jgi:MFS family permease
VATVGERRTLALLGLASLPFAFVNTLFTQTVSFAADDFGRSDADIGFGAAVVRWGVLIVPPIALIADRAGRRRVLVTTAWASPVLAALGALAPSYGWLVASQAAARPLALVMNVMILVMLTEEMSRELRARSIGYVGIASSAGAGAAVIALPLADVSPSGWRILYALSLVWLPVAYVLTRHLRETSRFTNLGTSGMPAESSTIVPGRLIVQIAAGFLTSIFVGAASVYLVNYLRDERNFDALTVSLFTVVTALPSGLGILLGGRLADVRGRRVIGALMLASGSLLVATSFAVHGVTMWVSEILGGICLGIAFPALGVYRGEMFPTMRRGLGASTVTAGNLIGGSIGLIVAGTLLDSGWSYARVMGTLVIAPLAVSVIVLGFFPETAHRELEELNPRDGAA